MNEASFAGRKSLAFQNENITLVRQQPPKVRLRKAVGDPDHMADLRANPGLSSPLRADFVFRNWGLQTLFLLKAGGGFQLSRTPLGPLPSGPDRPVIRRKITYTKGSEQMLNLQKPNKSIDLARFSSVRRGGLDRRSCFAKTVAPLGSMKST
jgi:hypothetical protein